MLMGKSVAHIEGRLWLANFSEVLIKIIEGFFHFLKKWGMRLPSYTGMLCFQTCFLTILLQKNLVTRGGSRKWRISTLGLAAYGLKLSSSSDVALFKWGFRSCLTFSLWSPVIPRGWTCSLPELHIWALLQTHLRLLSLVVVGQEPSWQSTMRSRFFLGQYSLVPDRARLHPSLGSGTSRWYLAYQESVQGSFRPR